MHTILNTGVKFQISFLEVYIEIECTDTLHLLFYIPFYE